MMARYERKVCVCKFFILVSISTLTLLCRQFLPFPSEDFVKHAKAEIWGHLNIGNIDKLPSWSKSYRRTELRDVFIGVKTTARFHQSRVQLILDTWYQLAPETYFFTDEDDQKYENKTNGHMINTNCQRGHSIHGLCCKLSAIFSRFNETNKRWLCHVDDDNYLNVPELIKLLRKFDHQQDYYIGRESIPHPKTCRDNETKKKATFWFATGGAGVCYSTTLAAKMMIYASGSNLLRMCTRIHQPDDVTIGFIVETILNKSLTRVHSLNFHGRRMADIPSTDIQNQVTLSYLLKDGKLNGQPNVINVTSIMRDDPTRFKSFHCKYFRGKGNGNCPPN